MVLLVLGVDPQSLLEPDRSDVDCVGFLQLKMICLDIQQKLKVIHMAATQHEVKELLKVVGHQVGLHHPRTWISEMMLSEGSRAGLAIEVKNANDSTRC